MLVLDGSQGEGGGQVLRTALALSMVTAQPFRIENIRANRPRPGLLQQHLTAVEAARSVCSARVAGVALGSLALEFHPGPVAPGAHSFRIGSAGSACLVLQTVLPALWSAGAPSTLEVEGGTHNPFAPPFEFLSRVFLPLLARMGPRVRAELVRHGFYPAGGGRVRLHVEPAPLAPLELLEAGELLRRSARALVARLPASIAERELEIVQVKLGWPREALAVEEVRDSAGPGNVLLLEVESEHVRELAAGFGEHHRSAEQVARQATDAMHRYLAARAPVGVHLADQLVLPFALAGGGRFRTLPLSTHAATNVEIVRRFLPVRIDVRPDGGACEVRFGA